MSDLGRVALVTTWGQQCGISTYSEQLAVALARADISVVAFAPALTDGGVALRNTRAQHISWQPVWDRQGGHYDHIVSFAQRSDVSIVHFQHEFGLFWNQENFLKILAQLRAAKIGTVVTLHTVHDSGGAAHTGFYGRLGRAADTVIVHDMRGCASLLAAGVSAVRIPHGTHAGGHGVASEGLKAINLPERLWARHKTWALVQGFIGSNKNVIGTVRAVAEAYARRRVSDLGLLIVGAVGGNANQYYNSLNAVVNECATGSTILLDTFIPEDKIGHVLALADFGILNTDSKVYSASGQVHQMAAFGVPLAVADRPIYADAVNAGAVPFRVDSSVPDLPTLSAINAVSALANSKGLRNRVRASLRSLAERTAWPVLVEKYYRPLYEHIFKRGEVEVTSDRDQT